MSGTRCTIRLVEWFDAHRRALPWRSSRTPYRVWVSEIMLQQTRVEAVLPYYRRFVRRFPSVRSLAAASRQDVLSAWEGLGFYSRARNLHAAARRVVSRHGGRLPRSAAELQALPGIGEYTAAAIASICFGEPTPALDGNVLRVATRYWGVGEDPRLPAVRRALKERLRACMPEDRPGDFNQALMELGAIRCRPRGALCGRCPLRARCAARRMRAVNLIPRRPAPARVPDRKRLVAVVRKRGRMLVCRCEEGRLLRGLWDLPGYYVGRSEPAGPGGLAEAVRRQTGITVRKGRHLATVTHVYSHFRVTIEAYECAAEAGQSRPGSRPGVRWCTRRELREYPFGGAARRVLHALE